MDEVPAPKDVLTAAELAELEILEKQMEQAASQDPEVRGDLQTLSATIAASRLHCSSSVLTTVCTLIVYMYILHI